MLVICLVFTEMFCPTFKGVGVVTAVVAVFALAVSEKFGNCRRPEGFSDILLLVPKISGSIGY